MWNGVHPSEFVFQKSRVIASDFCGIQTHESELRSPRLPMIGAIFSAMSFPLANSQKHQKSRSDFRKSWSEAGNHTSVWKKYMWMYHTARYLTHCGLDAIWRHGTSSTLVQVMACCLMIPIHQTKLKIAVLKWHLPVGLPGANELSSLATGLGDCNLKISSFLMSINVTRPDWWSINTG